MGGGPSSQALGRQGEQIVGVFLERHGYRILARNYRCRLGEIDLIAQHDSVIAFVEVRTRRGSVFGPPELSVDRRKQQRLIRTALDYLSKHRCGQCAFRFDVAAIEVDSRDLAKLRYIENAFVPDEEVGEH